MKDISQIASPTNRIVESTECIADRTNRTKNSIDQKELIHRMSDDVLVAKIKNLAAIERKLTQVMILHISEMDRRKLYLKFAYSSLFEYLIKEIGYSEGAAQRRIDAARLLVTVPELAGKIESGQIKLTQVSHLQKICRQVKKDSGRSVSAELRQEILLKLENKTSAATQVIVANCLNIESQQETSVRKSFQADESVRVELTFSKEEFALIQQVQASLSGQSGGEFKNTIVEMARIIEKMNLPNKKNIATSNATSTSPTEHVTQYNITATVAVKSGNEVNLYNKTYIRDKANKNHKANKANKTLTLKMKKEIKLRDQYCQFKDHLTGKVCGSRYYLEVDHIQPRFAGGDHAPGNLRMLCRNHNQFRYQVGI